MSKTATLDLTAAFTKSLVAELDRAETALRALYDAMPIGYGEDRSLNEAMILAEEALGIKRKVPHV